MPDHLDADKPLYGDDIKLIATRSRHGVLQSHLTGSVSWSKDQEVDLNPPKGEHLPIGNSVTYTLPLHNPIITWTTPKVPTTKDLDIVLNTRLSAEDNVASAANKVRRMLVYLTRS